MLSGKSAIVTGSTSGIGLGIARALAAEGCAVVLNSHEDVPDNERLRVEMAEETGSTVLFHRADVGRAEDVHGLVETALAALGRIDILVNNAGIQHVAPLSEFPDENWDRIIAINLSAAFHTIKGMFPGMLERRSGRIVNIASTHGLVASPFKAAYVAAKHGLVGLTKVTALEGAESGVTCNAICPGYVNTPLVEKQIEDQAKAHGIAPEDVIREVILAPQPNKDFVSIEQVAALAIFLCSEAGSSMNGAAIAMDGGWTAR